MTQGTRESAKVTPTPMSALLADPKRLANLIPRTAFSAGHRDDLFFVVAERCPCRVDEAQHPQGPDVLAVRGVQERRQIAVERREWTCGIVMRHARSIAQKSLWSDALSSLKQLKSHE